MKIFTARRPLSLLLAALGLAACQTPSWKYIEAPGTRLPGPAGSEVEIPAGWVVFDAGQALLITRDGPLVQQVSVVFTEQFRNNKRKVDPAAPPSELAELFVAEWKAMPNAGEVTVLENSPAQVAGREGFRLRFRNNLHQLRMPVDEYLVHGVGYGKGLYVISYGAWAGHHFQRDMPACETVVKSFRLPQ